MLSLINTFHYTASSMFITRHPSLNTRYFNIIFVEVFEDESLEGFIRLVKEGAGTYVIVSHDCYFIDRTADFVFEIEHSKLTVYIGNHSDYRKKKEEDRLHIETELQAVLGEFSLMKPGDKRYAELDKTFLQLSGLLRDLK